MVSRGVHRHSPWSRIIGVRPTLKKFNLKPQYSVFLFAGKFKEIMVSQ